MAPCGLHNCRCSNWFSKPLPPGSMAQSCMQRSRGHIADDCKLDDIPESNSICDGRKCLGVAVLDPNTFQRESLHPSWSSYTQMPLRLPKVPLGVVVLPLSQTSGWMENKCTERVFESAWQSISLKEAECKDLRMLAIVQ